MITSEFVSKLHKKFLDNPKNKLAVNLLANKRIEEASINREHFINNSKNVSYKKREFELSQSYFFFWNKFECSNWFLTNVINTRDRDILKDSIPRFIFSKPQEDGGQYAMLQNIVHKYGIVPKSVYPETAYSYSSREGNRLLNTKLREYGWALRKADEKDLPALKEKFLGEIYQYLCLLLGPPPSKFDFTYTDEDGNKVQHKGITPLDFGNNILKHQMLEGVSLINDPRNEYYKLYTVDYLGNVVDGYTKVLYLNLPMEDLKKYAKIQLDDNQLVWFGCDVGKERSNIAESLDLEIFDRKSLFDFEVRSTKEERLLTRQSVMTHAMTLNGYDEEEKTIKKWKVENSYGNKRSDSKSKDYAHGKQGFYSGYYRMTDEWFSEYGFQVVIEKKYLPKKILDILDTEPTVLDPWDPMGTLAQ